MIIVEGADNVGKSTLIKQLIAADPSLRLIDRPRFKATKAISSIGGSYLNALLPLDGDRFTHANSIADRLIASEAIYGELFRDGSRIRNGEQLALNLALTSYDALVVFCDPPDEMIMKSWVDRHQLYNNPLEIAHAYRENVGRIFPQRERINYDWSHDHALLHRENIVNRHHAGQTKRQDLLSWWAAMPYGVGQLDSSKCYALIVGESPSPIAQTSAPFAHGPAGDFLAWTIDRVEHRLGYAVFHNLYLTNADKETSHDAALLREEIRFLNPRVIIALGREAEEMARYVTSTDRIEALPHPMWWRRFRWERRHEYVTKFTKALRLTTL